MTILVINICKEKLHYFEFVKPVEDILKKAGKKFSTKHYKELRESDIEYCEKAIICGTSLKDNEFAENLNLFKWILNFDKPLLGICGGMQIIGRIFGARKRRKSEIGFFKEKFKEDFLGIQKSKEIEVYHLHNFFVNCPKDFITYMGENIPQAIKHKEKPIYGVLFHPEVRQKNMIFYFISLDS